jgi:hypothetical protein
MLQVGLGAVLQSSYTCNVALDFDVREIAVSSHQGSCLGCGICIFEVNMRLRWPNLLYVSTPSACILHIVYYMAIVTSGCT